MGIVALITAALQAFIKIADLLEFLYNTINVEIQKRDKRLADAQAEQTAINMAAAQNQAKRETANLAAFNLIMTVAIKDRYNQVLNYLNAGKTENVIAMTKMVNNEQVNHILFDVTSSNEAKAMYITQIMIAATPSPI